MKLFLEGFGLLMALCVFLPLIHTTNRWVRMMDFPRIQIAGFISLVLLFYIPFYFSLSPWPIAFVSILTIAWAIQARMIFPFTVLSPIQAARSKSPQPDETFCMMISNVRMDNKKQDEFLELVKEVNPDMLLVNEPDMNWAAKLKPLKKDYPYSILKPLNNTYGMMFFSKLPIHYGKVLFRVAEGIPSISAEIELPSGQRFQFYGVHPEPPTYDNNTEKREAELLLVGKEIKETGKPSIVAGDLNDVGWSYTTNLFKKISGTLDPRIGRGFFNTYSVFVPFFRYPLDHVFYSPQFQLVEMKRLPAFGSDHFPILIKLHFKPEEEHIQDVEHATTEDKQEAKELIQEGLASE